MKQFILSFWALSVLWLMETAVVWAQLEPEVVVTVRLRHSDGAVVVGEPVILLRPPDNDPIPPNCITDSQGHCSWFVRRGIYTVQFENYSLDALTRLAVAEGGLTGLTVTVGDEDIVYSFALANDNNVYNDLAPESSVPQPFIPKREDVIHIHDGMTPSIIGPKLQQTATDEALTPRSHEPRQNNMIDAPSHWQQWWAYIRLLLILTTGLLISWVVFLWKQPK